MRWGEECPYITPCGWCSRQGKPCEKRPAKPVRVHLNGMEKDGADSIMEEMKKVILAAEEKEG